MSENGGVQSRPHICRLCLAHTTTFFSLIDNQESSGMLQALTSLRILSDDVISTVMCLKCRLNLKLAYTIQQNMLRAEQRFRAKPVIKHEEITIKEESDEDKPNLKTILSLLKTYTCDICGKTKPSKSALHKHKYNVHVKVKCPICSKEITQTNFKHHLERHEGSPTICELCGVTIKNRTDLRAHMYHLHKTGKHKCRFCGKVFKMRYNMTAHENREHLDQADFVCDICGKKFYAAHQLRAHTRCTHLKLRPHICDFCKVGFSSRYALKTHRRQHTNETPFRCDVCGEGYRQRVSLKSHLKSKHDIEEECNFECQVCGKKFATKAALYPHQRLHIDGNGQDCRK